MGENCGVLMLIVTSLPIRTAAGERHRVFVNSLSDFFEDRQDLILTRKRAWDVIRECQNLDWLLLTKRPENIQWMVPDHWGTGWNNVWIGTTVEDQEYANKRIPHLLSAPAEVRFLSIEPMLGPVDLNRIDATKAGWRSVNGFPEPVAISAFGRWQETPMRARLQNGVDWVIVGGESGPNAREFNFNWARSVVEQCKEASVAVFVKQLGAVPRWEPEVGPDWWKGHINGYGHPRFADKKGGDWNEWPEEFRVRQFPR
jgi:protein gp37